MRQCKRRSSRLHLDFLEARDVPTNLIVTYAENGIDRIGEFNVVGAPINSADVPSNGVNEGAPGECLA